HRNASRFQQGIIPQAFGLADHAVQYINDAHQDKVHQYGGKHHDKHLRQPDAGLRGRFEKLAHFLPGHQPTSIIERARFVASANSVSSTRAEVARSVVAATTCCGERCCRYSSTSTAPARSLQTNTMSQPADSAASARCAELPAIAAPAIARSSEKITPEKPSC